MARNRRRKRDDGGVGGVVNEAAVDGAESEVDGAESETMYVEATQAPQMPGASKRLRRKTRIGIRNQEDVLVQTFATWFSFLIESNENFPFHIPLRSLIIFWRTRLLSKGLRNVCDTEIFVTFSVKTQMVFQVLECLTADTQLWLSQTDGGRDRINQKMIPSDTMIPSYEKFFCLPWLRFVPILKSWCTDTARRTLETNKLWQQTCTQIFVEFCTFGFRSPVHMDNICLPT